MENQNEEKPIAVKHTAVALLQFDEHEPKPIAFLEDGQDFVIRMPQNAKENMVMFKSPDGHTCKIIIQQINTENNGN